MPSLLSGFDQGPIARLRATRQNSGCTLKPGLTGACVGPSLAPTCSPILEQLPVRRSAASARFAELEAAGHSRWSSACRTASKSVILWDDDRLRPPVVHAAGVTGPFHGLFFLGELALLPMGSSCGSPLEAWNMEQLPDRIPRGCDDHRFGAGHKIGIVKRLARRANQILCFLVERLPMDPLSALVCAMLLTDLPLPPSLPRWEERSLTSEERLRTNRPRNTRAMYDRQTLTIVSPPGDWPGLVHEMVHHLEYWAGVPLDRVTRQCRGKTRQRLPELATQTVLRRVSLAVRGEFVRRFVLPPHPVLPAATYFSRP